MRLRASRVTRMTKPSEPSARHRRASGDAIIAAACVARIFAPEFLVPQVGSQLVNSAS